MRKLALIAAVAVMAGTAFAAFPTRTTSTTVDVSKVTGNFDSFNWRWQATTVRATSW